jgi:hypothetical protein
MEALEYMFPLYYVWVESILEFKVVKKMTRLASGPSVFFREQPAGWDWLIRYKPINRYPPRRSRMGEASVWCVGGGPRAAETVWQRFL